MSLEMLPYQDITTDKILAQSHDEAERQVVELIAQRSRVKGGGDILSWGDFNENPDPLINLLLAKLLLDQVTPAVFENLKPSQVAVLSIENSAGYLASEVTHEIERKYGFTRPPRIIRARKTPDGLPPSPAMGEIVSMVEVRPITSGGQVRYLIASMPDKKDLEDVRILITVDDFRATGDTLRGGTELGISLLEKSGVPLNKLTVIPMAGLGKPEQAIVQSFGNVTNVNITPIITAINVKFWGDQVSGEALIQANGLPPTKMQNANASDFNNP